VHPAPATWFCLVTVLVAALASRAAAQPLDAAARPWPAERAGAFPGAPQAPQRLPQSAAPPAAPSGAPAPYAREMTPPGPPAARGDRTERLASLEVEDRAAAPPPAPENRLMADAQILAVVGDQTILAGDLLGQVNELLAPYADELPTEALEQQRQRLLRQMLPRAIETKMVYLDFLRTVPPDKLSEIQKRVSEQYDKTELEKALENAQVKSPAELDAVMRRLGSSLEKQRRVYAEQLLAREMIRRNVKQDEEISHDEMLDFYRRHLDQYELPAKVRWEQLTARLDSFPSKAEAYRAVAEMGNEVLRGAPLPAVARRRSQGVTAEQGGYHDWTTQGSLKSQVLDQALFTLPEGRLSQILEDERGFHIVRVLERADARRVPFTETQAEIKEKLRKARLEQQVKQYLDRLRQTTHVWTAFDAEPAPAGGDPSPEGAAE